MKTSSEQKLSPEIKEHIETLERVRRDFIANVSHELRTPLTVVHGYLELLLEDKEDAKHSVFTQMFEHTLRMQTLIEDLLLLSRLETHIDEQEQEKVHVAGVLKAISNTAKDISGKKNHTIILNADEKLFLLGNEHELKSLFSNIVINAVKYTSANGKIYIDWKLDDGRAVFQVKDTGIGIAKEHLPRITERFYRVDKARSRESGGTGLGLAIAKHVILRHDAVLDIDSVEGQGSCFRIVFPKKRVAF